MKDLICIFILIFCNTILFSQTTIPGGDVYGTWLQSGSPYLIEGEITIPDGQTLTIDPGCLIEFQGHYKFNVQGTLLAEGTEQDSIKFTVADTTGFYNNSHTGWHGIRFDNTPATNDSSRIKYCIIEYGKAVGDLPEDREGGGIYIFYYSQIEFSNNLVHKNFTESICGGIYVFESNILIQNSIIQFNRAYGIHGFYNQASPVVDNCIISNNTRGGIHNIKIISNSEIYANEDAGIENSNSIINCKVYNNSPGISIIGYHCTLMNSLIYSNSYGLTFEDFGMYEDLVIINSTFTDNNYGIGIYAFETSPEITLINTILHLILYMEFMTAHIIVCSLK